MRVVLCLSIVTSAAMVLAIQPTAAAADMATSGTAAITTTTATTATAATAATTATVHSAHVPGCSHCQVFGGLRRMGEPGLMTPDGCRIDVCAQAAAAGLNLGCCDPDARPYFELWSDYCSQRHRGFHLGHRLKSCMNCQTGGWGRNVSACGGHCGLGLHGRHCSHCSSAAGTCDSTLSPTVLNGSEQAPEVPAEVDSSSEVPSAVPAPLPEDQASGDGWLLPGLRRTQAEPAVQSGFLPSSSTETLPVTTTPSLWQRLRGRF